VLVEREDCRVNGLRDNTLTRTNSSVVCETCRTMCHHIHAAWVSKVDNSHVSMNQELFLVHVRTTRMTWYNKSASQSWSFLILLTIP
jgi:hypothetical protein